MNSKWAPDMNDVFPFKFDQNQQQPEACPGNAIHGDWRHSLGALVSPGLVVCLVSLLLGTSIFAVSASGNIVGYILGYVGEAFRRGTQLLAIPLWFVAWHFAHSRRELRVKLDISTVLPLFMLLPYISIHLLFAEPITREHRFEMVLSTAPIVLLALPLCRRRGCELFWYGMMVAGIIFSMTLLFSGQLLSIVRGEGLIGLADETSSRLHLGLDTISSASIMYQCVLAGILWLLTYPRKSASTLVILATCASLLLCGVMTGSKGPLVSFIVALVTFLLVKRVSGMKWVYLAIIGVTFYQYGLPVLSNYEGSIKHLATGATDEGRQMYYSYVLNSVPTLFGEGVGSFTNETGAVYVHNTTLEMYYEMGVIGVGLFIWVVVAMARKLIQDANQSPVASFILAYFAYSLTTTMFSGSIFGDTPLWLALVFGSARFSTPDQGNQI